MRETANIDRPGTPHRVGRYEVLLDLQDEGFVSLRVASVRGPNAGPRVVELARVERSLARSVEVKAAFLAEARAAGRVRHPNFVHPIDTLVHDGDLYAATEFVHGTRLDELRQAAAGEGFDLPLSVSLRIVLDVLAGLSALHASGANTAGSRPIVHGDVAPTNIFITAEGETRLVHSGLSLVTSQAGAIGRQNERLSYKAPEQLRTGVNAVAIGPEADVFAAGVLLWEALQGARLFADASDVDVVEHILYGQIPPLEPGGSRYMPLALLPLVGNALERNANVRVPNAATLAEAIERAPGVRLASSEEVADVVDQLMGPLIERRRSVIDQLVARSGDGAKSEGSIRPVVGSHRPVGSMRTPVGFVYPPPSSTPSSSPSSAPVSPRMGSSPGYQVLPRHRSVPPSGETRIVPPHLTRTMPPATRSTSTRIPTLRSSSRPPRLARTSAGSWAYYLGIGAAAGGVIFSLLRIVTGLTSSAGTSGVDTTMVASAPPMAKAMGANGIPTPPNGAFPSASRENSAAIPSETSPATSGSVAPTRLDPAPNAAVSIGSSELPAPSAKPAKARGTPPTRSNIPLGI